MKQNKTISTFLLGILFLFVFTTTFYSTVLNLSNPVYADENLEIKKKCVTTCTQSSTSSAGGPNNDVTASGCQEICDGNKCEGGTKTCTWGGEPLPTPEPE